MWTWIIGGGGVALLFWPVWAALARRLRGRRHDRPLKGRWPR